MNIICAQDEAFAMTGRDTVVGAAYEFLRRGCSFVVITSSARGADLMYLEGSPSNLDGEDTVNVIHQDTIPVEVTHICKYNISIFTNAVRNW